MLKTRRNDTVWLVTQPDHAEVSGYLAAHWGNDDFAQPGYYAKSGDPERLRAETVFGIAEHDNGWWEWEADPVLSEADGLPLGLSELLQDTLAGMDRWRLCIPRFSQNHPYASLLISFHAYWLYARNVHAESEAAFSHSLFTRDPQALLSGSQFDHASNFINEIEAMQEELVARLRSDPVSAAWVEPEHLNPHVRLLQVLDGLSLSLSTALVKPLAGESRGLGEDAFDLCDVPRRNWDDRVRMELRPSGEGRITCQPYPFDDDPLPVFMPARILDLSRQPVHWRKEPRRWLRFEYCSA